LSGFHLVRPKAEVLKDLRKQISKGRDIADYGYDDDEVEDAINDETKWDLLNVEILRREFSDDTPLNEYKSIQLTKYYGDWEDRLVTHEIRVRKRITFLESLVQRINKNLIPESGESVTRTPPGGERVFIIHGHDEASKSQVARLVEKLGFTAVILAEQTNRGRTIIEKLERHSDVAFAVAILTPDDVVGIQSARARQNVILELGHFEGKLGRDRVCILYTPGVDIPSDIRGVAFYELDKAGAWRYSLAKELKDAGFPVDMNKL
jgi:predicted nucleotide-binding protein